MLYPFQTQTILKFLKATWHRWVAALPTGSGKSATAICAAHEINAKRILVFTKAIVRRQWRDEFDLWWEGHPEVGVIEMGRARKAGVTKKAKLERGLAYAAPIQIVSYALAKEVEAEPWDMIVLDEMHLLQGTDTRVTNIVTGIIEANPKAAVLGLTATLIPNDVCNLWAPLNAVWPLRFGKQSKAGYVPYRFATRYSIAETKIDEDTGEKYGTVFKGLNPIHADELRMRLAAISTQVTKQEIAQYLPPLRIQLTRIKPDKVSFANLEDWKEQNGNVKLPYVREWAESLPADVGNVVIGCYLRETARKIGNELRSCQYRPVQVVTGDEPAATRNETIKAALQQGNSILVCTLHSVGTGIDSLANCSSVLMAELYDRVSDTTQFFGRFHRLSSKDPTLIQILAVEGTKDEKIAQSLKGKEESIAKLIKQDMTDQKFIEAVSKSEEDLTKEMLAAFSLEEEEEYG